MHSRNIAHRDIKLDNVLIEETTRAIKLIDFGFSVVTPSDGGKLKIFCGTPSYMAPELVRKHSYDGKQVDMWALGVLLYVMLTGVLPFRGSTEKELFDKIQKGKFCMTHSRLESSRDAQLLIKGLLRVDGQARMTAEQVINHPFVKCDDLNLSIYESASSILREE